MFARGSGALFDLVPPGQKQGPEMSNKPVRVGYSDAQVVGWVFVCVCARVLLVV